MTNGNAKIEIPNFAGMQVWRWSQGCYEPMILFAYFSYIREHLLWIETEGKNLLESIDPWSHEQFNVAKDSIGLLVYDISKLEPFTNYLRIVLRKGIASLKTLTESGQIQHEQADLYLRSITFFLETGGPCEIKTNGEDGVKMIDSLIPIAQFFKDEHMLERIGRCRLPNGDLPLELYVKHFKNW